MKIGEFAELNQVTAKMLRHYDEIGLLKPAGIDSGTGYRSYATEQSHRLNWILILKNLDFALSEIKALLSGPIERQSIVRQLIRKRIEIASALNEQIQKKLAIDRLIAIIEKEGFEMNMNIDLQHIGPAGVQEIKKNIPNMEMFLETAASIASLRSDGESHAVFRFDISHFKQVNDDYGFEAGDSVILACYRMIESNVKTYLHKATVGRAAGDEFIVYALADRDAAMQTARSIIDDMKRFDFAAIGCPKQMGCYIGGMAGTFTTGKTIRRIIEDSMDVLERARRNGPNSYLIEPCGDR